MASDLQDHIFTSNMTYFFKTAGIAMEQRIDQRADYFQNVQIFVFDTKNWVGNSTTWGIAVLLGVLFVFIPC